jgi:hypothetical protein
VVSNKEDFNNLVAYETKTFETIRIEIGRGGREFERKLLELNLPNEPVLR